MNHILRVLSLTLVLTTWLVAAAEASVPGTIAVEGALLSANGAPAADGTYDLTFALYTDPLVGNQVWGEGPIKVSVKSGQWQYMLGSSKALTGAVLASAPLYLGLQVASDPELPRKGLTSVAFAVRSAVAEAVECSGCIGSAQIDAKVMADIGKTIDLSPYAKTASLAKVATTGNYADLAGGPDLSPYAKSANLAKVATTGAYADLSGTPDLSPYVKAAALAKVAGTGSYTDLSSLPTLAQVGKGCGTGLVMSGIKADGSYECSASAIAGDMIDEISNGLIWDQFTDSSSGPAAMAIQDGFPAGTASSLTFPNIGQAQKIWVDVNIANNDISKLQLLLYGPGIADPYVVYDKTGTGKTLKTTFNTTTPIAGGQFDKDWAGKNLQGTWTLLVKDLADDVAGATDGTVDWTLSIQTLSNQKIQIKANLIVDKDVTIGGNLNVTGSINGAGYRPVLRYANFSTFDQPTGGWDYGNGGTWTLGIAPSTWTDGSAKIWSITTDKNLWRNVLTKSIPIYPTMAVVQDSWYDPSSTNGHVAIVLFRIKNTTANPINWSPSFMHTNCGSWGEHSSLTVNGAGTWSHGGDCYGSSQCVSQPTVAIPGARISSVMMAVMSGCGGGMRSQILAFTGDTLKLPAGLQYVDDLDSATGGWEQ